MKFEDRHYINVPYADRRKVKVLGAQYDSTRKFWYVHKDTDPKIISQWDSISSVSGKNVSPVEEFGAFCKKHGLIINGDPIMDGKSHRVSLQGERDKNKKSGKYCGYLDGKPAGWVMNFRDGGGKAVKWKASGVFLNSKDDKKLKEAWAAKAAERKAKIKAQYKEASEKASKIWSAAKPIVKYEHPYLRKKGVRSHGLRQGDNGKIIVPVRNIEGNLCSLEFISEKSKLFLSKSEKVGGFHTIAGKGSLEKGPIIIAEGYSTAASIYEATGLSVVIAFDGGNLIVVGEILRKRYKMAPIFIAADDDHKLEARDPPLPNAGIKNGTAAAEACGGDVIIVALTDEMKAAGASDFNDVHAIAGLDEVKRQIMDGIANAEKASQPKKAATRKG